MPLQCDARVITATVTEKGSDDDDDKKIIIKIHRKSKAGHWGIALGRPAAFSLWIAGFLNCFTFLCVQRYVSAFYQKRFILCFKIQPYLKISHNVTSCLAFSNKTF